MANSLLAPSSTFPIATIIDDTINFSPLVSVSAEFTFLKKPTEPFYDYYTDAGDNIIYLPVGPYSISAGETYRDGTPGPTSGTSASVELPFPDNERLDVAYKILQKFGIPVQEVMATEFGAIREQKEENL